MVMGAMVRRCKDSCCGVFLLWRVNLSVFVVEGECFLL